MPSPFPGMDPYLEGYLWPDVHRALAAEIRRRLVPLLRPRYVARLEVYVVEDESPELELGILYPDVEVLATARQPSEQAEGAPEQGRGSAGRIQAPLTIPVLSPVEHRLVTVEIRDAAHNELVTSIEILSPVNKREPGLSRQRRKHERLHRQGVHYLEIDLLRRGARPLTSHPGIPAVDYLITLTRAHASSIEVWPVPLRDALPVIPVPLRDPDPDVALELSPAFATVYDEAAYDLSVDYNQDPPPPPLSPEERAWVRELTEGAARKAER